MRAAVLGCAVHVGITSDQVHELIDGAEDSFDAPNELQWRIARHWNMADEMDLEDTRGDFGDVLWDRWMEDDELEFPDDVQQVLDSLPEGF